MPRRSIGKILREARISVGLSQSDLARSSNHSPGFISRIESEGDAESIKFATLVSLAIPLGLSLDEIAFLTGLSQAAPGASGSDLGPAIAQISVQLGVLKGALEVALRKLSAAELEIYALSTGSQKDKKRSPPSGRPSKSQI